MGLTIREKADILGTFRFISVHVMEQLARWVPTTAELEVKLLFGRHIWDFAQHADQLGKRTAELRAPLHHSLRPTPGYLQVLDDLAAASGTRDRVAGFYGVALSDIEARYRRYLEETDPLLDEPTIRILERILRDCARLRSDCEEMLRQRPELGGPPGDWVERLGRRAAAVQDFVAYRPAQKAAAGELM